MNDHACLHTNSNAPFGALWNVPKGAFQNSLMVGKGVRAKGIPDLSQVEVPKAAVELHSDVLGEGPLRDIQTVGRGVGNAGPQRVEVRTEVPSLIADVVTAPLHDRCEVGRASLCVQTQPRGHVL